VAMPRLDGVRLTAILRERGLVIPTILMSAAGEPPGHAAFLFVSKPFELDHLLAVVERAIAAPGTDHAAARIAADD
jgi:FixJ family two-component response regulator